MKRTIPPYTGCDTRTPLSLNLFWISYFKKEEQFVTICRSYKSRQQTSCTTTTRAIRSEHAWTEKYKRELQLQVIFDETKQEFAIAAITSEC